jgi:hypothetical protein
MAVNAEWDMISEALVAPRCEHNLVMPTSLAVQFAQFIVTSQVFYTTKLCAAIVNLKPILPGHSLVIPRRIVPRYADLSQDEVTLRISAPITSRSQTCSLGTYFLFLVLLQCSKGRQSTRKGVSLHIIYNCYPGTRFKRLFC